MTQDQFRQKLLDALVEQGALTTTTVESFYENNGGYIEHESAFDMNRLADELGSLDANEKAEVLETLVQMALEASRG